MHTQSNSTGNITHRTDSSTTAQEHFTTTAAKQTRPILPETDHHPTSFTYHPPSPSTSIQTTHDQLPQNQTEQTASPSTDSAGGGGGGGKHGNSAAVIAGVSISIVALVLLAAAAVIIVVVVYLVRKKQAPQSRGFTRLPVISTDNKAVPV